MTTIVVEPGRSNRNYWRDLWAYRELFYVLSWRDVAVRYKQTVIGVAWAVIRPFLTVVVFTLVFSKIARLPAPNGVPYALMVMAGMLPWQFFSTAMSESSNSLINNANLISKTYFPRLIVPAAAVITSFVDFVITLGMMALLMVWYGFLPDARILALPLFVLLGFALAIGTGLWLCALNLVYRDFRYIVPFVVQLGLYISPVGFSSQIVPPSYRFLYWLNPMVGVIDGFRWSLLRGQTGYSAASVLTSAVVSAVLCVTGLWYFRRTERTFADVI